MNSHLQNEVDEWVTRTPSQNGTTDSDSQRVGYAAGWKTNVAQSYMRKEPVDEE